MAENYAATLCNTSQESRQFDEQIDITLVSNSEPSLVDAHEETSSGSNQKTPIMNSSTPEKHSNYASEAVVVTPIKSIDWDKEVQSKIEEWRKMEKEKTLDLNLLIEYTQNVKERLHPL